MHAAQLMLGRPQGSHVNLIPRLSCDVHTPAGNSTLFTALREIGSCAASGSSRAVSVTQLQEKGSLNRHEYALVLSSRGGRFHRQ